MEWECGNVFRKVGMRSLSMCDTRSAVDTDVFILQNSFNHAPHENKLSNTFWPCYNIKFLVREKKNAPQQRRFSYLGRKTFKIDDRYSSRDRFLKIVERDAGSVRSIWVEEEGLRWICSGLAEIGTKPIGKKSMRVFHGRVSTLVMIKKSNQIGSLVHIEERNGDKSRKIYIPKVDRGGGRRVAADVFRMGQILPKSLVKEGKSFMEAALISGWPGKTLVVRRKGHNKWADLEVDLPSCKERLDFLKRCLVGRVGGDLDPVLDPS
ncbi:hypothetical protein F0562_025269 [Nyssa sinensis]|uniref:Uncharacterized protein n=1 Tax=Nyssa sinensis TaxID=561372 RepID=A0A5J5BFB3_9ASTE|nr:hypothetical protein F0562_025269 [Nyssa sinensis]